MTIKGGTIESHGIFTGIASNLLITGGKVIATGRSTGITTGAGWIKFNVIIAGGTVIAQGVNDLTALLEPLFINGGSVNAKKVDGTILNGNGNTVYLVTVTVGETPDKNTEVSCSINGGTAFTCITDADGKLYLWMPDGNGAAEVNAGGTLFRASGSVAANYDNVMLALPPPVVTCVVVSPAYTTALTGRTVQYLARAEGLYDPPQTVTWKVENGHQGTSISDSGLLTFSPNERSTNLLVTATSTYDPSKSGTVQVAVLSVTGIIIGAVFFFLLFVSLAVFLEVRNPFRQ